MGNSLRPTFHVAFVLRGAGGVPLKPGETEVWERNSVQNASAAPFCNPKMIGKMEARAGIEFGQQVSDNYELKSIPGFAVHQVIHQEYLQNGFDSQTRNRWKAAMSLPS